MTQYEILKMAYDQALAIWSREEEYVRELPDNPYTKARCEDAWKKVEILHEMILKEEQAR